jgi:aspartate kinase
VLNRRASGSVGSAFKAQDEREDAAKVAHHVRSSSSYAPLQGGEGPKAPGWITRAGEGRFHDARLPRAFPPPSGTRQVPPLQSNAVTEIAYEAVPSVQPLQQRASFATIVMKFGGTSVADPEKIRRVARRLASAKRRGSRVVGVVSAMGHHTDELVSLAHQVSPRPKPRELDMLISVGERISCALVAMAISDLGHDAISLTGSQAGIVTDTVHGKAKIVDVRARRIHEALDEEKIVLVAGFQGVSTAYDITTLGRGGSDTTAVALAAALGAGACEIYTDVDGVFTADPRVVPGARKLHAVSYEEMLEMSASGARVLQLRSVEFARNHDVKLHVRSTFTDEEGTWIREEDERMLEKAMISGVTYALDERLYEVDGTSPAALFGAVAESAVSVDTLIQIGPQVVFSAPSEDHHDVEAALEGLHAQWRERDDLAKVSVVGAGMRSHPGLAARALATLGGLGIEPAYVSTSTIRIALFVPREEVERAVQSLHDAFDLSEASAERQHA